MKRKPFFCTIPWLLILLSARSQHVETLPKLKFQSNLQSGILIGQKGSSPALSVSAVNGVQYKTWFSGIGLGLDYYGSKRTAPLFLAVQKDLSASRKTWFGYLNAGDNIPWIKDNQKLQHVNQYKATGGLFYELGGGYKFTIFNKTHIGLSAGYSYKQVKEKYTPPCIWCEWNIPPEQIITSEFRRITLQVNWWLQ